MRKILISLISILLVSTGLLAQQTITIPVSDGFHKSNFYKSLFGEHYRKEWQTPVTFRIATIDTLAGGLIPYQIGGSRQTRSLRLRDKQGREYVLRSVFKTFAGALPDITQGSFIEDMANDQVTMSHPYAALVVAPLAEAAGILHTNPKYYYIPKHAALGSFNDSIGDALYLFEQRPDENWETAPNFAYSKNIVGTEKLLEKVVEDNDNVVDQKLFLRSRLFDMLIGDWGRHEDQWRWAKTEIGDLNIYKPIPRDRDNALSKLDGVILNKLLPMQMQSFDSRIKDVPGFNNTARNLDHRFLNELSYQDWMEVASDMKSRLTDVVIEDAVRQMPHEAFPISGPGIIANLKSRRDQLSKYAEEYYDFLAKWGIDIPGTEKAEYFLINRLADNSTEVKIYDIKKDGSIRDQPFYSRIIDNSVKQIRLYAIDGADSFVVNGKSSKPAKLLILDGEGREKYSTDNNTKIRKAKVLTETKRKAKEEGGIIGSILHMDNLSKPTEFVYDNFRYNKSGFTPIAFYNQDDRIHVGLSHKKIFQRWDKEPYFHSHTLAAKYSIEQNGISLTYKGSIAEFPGKWFTNLYVNWDQIRWQNFFGLGNESAKRTNDMDYYRIRSKQFIVQPSMERIINNRHKIIIAPFYQTIDVITDKERYMYLDNKYNSPANYKNYKMAGGSAEYLYQHLNDSILPVKGFVFYPSIRYTSNLTDHHFDHWTANAMANVLVPFTKTIGVNLQVNGEQIISGNPLIYQYAKIGGNSRLRGVQRDRFHGEKAFSSQNELRWIKDVRSYWYNGKIGIFGLYDIGRVWMDNEKSNTWHYGYGGGIILSPFNKITGSLAYAKSKDDFTIHIGLITPL